MPTGTTPLRAPPTDPPARKRRKFCPLVADAKRLSKLLDCGIRTVRTLDAAGKLPAPIRVGGRVLWRVSEIRDWLNVGAPCREIWERLKATRSK